MFRLWCWSLWERRGFGVIGDRTRMFSRFYKIVFRDESCVKEFPTTPLLLMGSSDV